MDASYKIQRGIHVHLIQFFMCPEFWVHISSALHLMLRESDSGMLLYRRILLCVGVSCYA